MYANNGLRLFSIADGRLLAKNRDYDSNSYSAHFSSDGRLVTTSLDGYLRLYRFDGKKLTQLAKRTAPGGKRIAVGFNDAPAVNILNAKDMTLDCVLDTVGVNNNLCSTAWSQKGDFLYAAGIAQRQFGGQWQQYIRRWSITGKGTPVDWPVASDTIMDIVPLPDGRLVYGAGDPSWGVVDAQGRRTLVHAPVVADFRGNHEGFSLSADGSQVRFGYECFGKSPAIFDCLNRAFVAGTDLTAPVLTAPGLEVTDWKDTFSPKRNGSPLKLEPYEASRSLALLPKGEGFALGAEWSLHLFDRNGQER